MSAPACPGTGKCHGPVRWCGDCGDVGAVCDMDECDSHERGYVWDQQREREAWEAQQALEPADGTCGHRWDTVCLNCRMPLGDWAGEQCAGAESASPSTLSLVEAYGDACFAAGCAPACDEEAVRAAVSAVAAPKKALLEALTAQQEVLLELAACCTFAELAQPDEADEVPVKPSGLDKLILQARSVLAAGSPTTGGAQ